jgi:REP element-mobilizing transposase RayT
MARKLRVQYPGAIYHLMNRGDRREPIFKDDVDRERFLQTLGEACAKTNWQVHALCLMPNHFHLVVETPRANLVSGMTWFLGTYTGRFNRRHKLFGHLFSGRYKALVVDGSGNGYLRTVCDYVHLNPVRAKLIAASEPLRSYRWSSFGEYLKASGRRWEWLRVDRLLGDAGIPRDSTAGRRQFEKLMEKRRDEESSSAEWQAVRRGWFLGDAQLRKELLAQMHERFGAHHGGEEREESCEARAERLLESELERLRWTREQLARWRKGDARKVRLARRLREETTMTLEWIAQRLAMGSASTVALSLRRSC